MSSVLDSLTELAEGQSRRQRAEASIEQVWHDDARRAFAREFLEPLDGEADKMQAAIRELGAGIARAMAALA